MSDRIPPENLPSDPPSGAQEAPAALAEAPTSGLTQQGPSRGSGQPPAHVLAAGQYAATFRDRDPLQARTSEIPGDWRATVQHSASTPEEKERFRAHREALGVFLGLLVAVECEKVGLGVPGLAPVEPAFGLDVLRAEIEVVAAQFYLEDANPKSAGRFSAALGMFCCVHVMRWLRLAQAQAQQGPKLITPGDRGFASEAQAMKNREQRRREKRGNGRRV